MLYKPGESGNPSGKSAVKQAQLRDLLLPHVGKAVQVIVTALHGADTKVALTAAHDLIDRLYGKAPQALEVSGSINHQIELVDIPNKVDRQQWIQVHQTTQTLALDELSKTPQLLNQARNSQQ
jgi:hypothetical protein